MLRSLQYSPHCLHRFSLTADQLVTRILTLTMLTPSMLLTTDLCYSSDSCILCQHPDMTRAMLRLSSLPEVRVHAEIVPHTVLPPVIISTKIRIVGTEHTILTSIMTLPTAMILPGYQTSDSASSSKFHNLVVLVSSHSSN